MRQYIGARYVPKFFTNSATGDSTWASGTAYEALTIVSWNNCSYTSKIPVPASVGAPNLNPEYWVMTSRVSADIEEIRDEISTINSEIDDINDDLTDIHNEINDIKSEGQYIVVFGDSWADAAHDSNVQIHILAYKLGLTLKNYSLGGTGFDAYGGYNDQLDQFIADTSFDHKKVKYVVLIAGLNEYHNLTPAEFTAKLNAFGARVRGAVDCPFYWFHNYSLENDMTTKTRSTKYYVQFQYYDYIVRAVTDDINACLTFGWAGAGNWNTNNYYHLTPNGSNQYFSNVANAIQGMPPTIYEYDKFELYWDGEATQTFRRVYIEFYLMGYDLNACVRTTCGGAVSFPGTHADLPSDRPLPCQVSPSLLIDGVVFSGTNGVPALDAANPAAKTASIWNTTMGGYASIFAKGY